MIELLLLLASSVQAAPPPPSGWDGVEPEAQLRAFVPQGDFQYYFDASARGDWGQSLLKGITLGSYYRVLSGLKVGAFYKGASGVRHDRDWTKSSGAWAWDDVSSRWENSALLDVTPRASLEPWLSREWVVELKARAIRNFSLREDTVSLRPGIFYFWMKGDLPFLNLFAQLELNLPLNYGHRPINELWAYTGALYSLSERFLVGGFVAYRSRTWESSPAFLAADPTNAYSVKNDALVLSLVGVLQFDLF